MVEWNKDLPDHGDSEQVRSEPLIIRSYDVDFRRELTLESLCRYFLEAAWNHAEALGVGFGHLAAENRVWVLSRLLIQIEVRAQWGQRLVLRTWPRGKDPLFALRDFEVVDSENKSLAAGTSAWLVLDRTSRRPQRIEKVVGGIKTQPRRATERDPEKLAGLPAANATSGLSTSLQAETAWQVRYSDEDLNGHVNSVRYVRWMLDTYPPEWHRTHSPKQIEINYVGECRGGDFVRVKGQALDDLTFAHVILKEPAHEACRAQLQWSKT